MANKRDALRRFRRSYDLSQKQMAEKLNYSFSHYSLIERGLKDGSQDFWNKLQQTFDIPDADMWSLIK